MIVQDILKRIKYDTNICLIKLNKKDKQIIKYEGKMGKYIYGLDFQDLASIRDTLNNLGDDENVRIVHMDKNNMCKLEYEGNAKNCMSKLDLQDLMKIDNVSVLNEENKLVIQYVETIGDSEDLTIGNLLNCLNYGIYYQIVKDGIAKFSGQIGEKSFNNALLNNEDVNMLNVENGVLIIKC